MQNKDAKQGYPIYILNRKDIKVDVGKVVNAPLSHFDQQFAGKMVVDLVVEVCGKSSTYVLEDSSEFGYVGDIMVTLNRECVQRELERIKSQSEQALKMVEYHKSAVEKCDTLLKEYSPEYRERTEASERMNALEGKVDKLAEALGAFLTQQKGGIK